MNGFASAGGTGPQFISCLPKLSGVSSFFTWEQLTKMLQGSYAPVVGSILWPTSRAHHGLRSPDPLVSFSSAHEARTKSPIMQLPTELKPHRSNLNRRNGSRNDVKVMFGNMLGILIYGNIQTQHIIYIYNIYMYIYNNHLCIQYLYIYIYIMYYINYKIIYCKFRAPGRVACSHANHAA